MSLSHVHAWSLVITVSHVNDCNHCCRCSVAASVGASLLHLEPRQRTRRLFVDTPSWCDGSLTITPPTVEEVVDIPAVLLGCLFVAAVALFFDDTVVRCLCCLAVSAEALTHDDAEVVSVDCCTDGVEALNQDDVEVVNVGCPMSHRWLCRAQSC